MLTYIIFDNDYERRGILCSGFESQGYRVHNCYSESKLFHIVEKLTSEAFILFCHESIELSEKTNALSMLRYNNESTVSDLLAEVNKSGLINSALETEQTYDLICIGSSTGGLPVVQNTLKGIRNKKTIVVICQHISKKMDQEIFKSVGKSLNGRLKKVSTQIELAPGYTYVLSGGSDYVFSRKYGKFFLIPEELSSSPYHPSFDRLLGSLKGVKNMSIACLIFSGLGDDGSKHLKELKKQNVTVVAQDPSSSVAPYMPKSAIATGCVEHVFNEEQLQSFLQRKSA